MNNCELRLGDCLEIMKEIPSGSVDLVLCDLPYGIMKGFGDNGTSKRERYSSHIWDDVIDTEKLFSEYERVLRMNGVAVLFSMEPYTSELRSFKLSGKVENFKFSQSAIWKKESFGNKFLCNKALLSFFEDLSIFTKRHDSTGEHPLRPYVAKMQEFIGLSKKQIIEKIGGRVDHFLRHDSAQFALCTSETYQALIDEFRIDTMEGFKPFSELQQLDALKSKKTFNLLGGARYNSNVFEFKKDVPSLHPTQKPVALLESIIRIYSNEGDLVLDNCMGVGSTGAAALRTGRRFFGIEKDAHFYDIAEKRLKEELNG